MPFVKYKFVYQCGNKLEKYNLDSMPTIIGEFEKISDALIFILSNFKQDYYYISDYINGRNIVIQRLNDIDKRIIIRSTEIYQIPTYCHIEDYEKFDFKILDEKQSKKIYDKRIDDNLSISTPEISAPARLVFEK
jgi:hypothetical protein